MSVLKTHFLSCCFSLVFFLFCFHFICPFVIRRRHHRLHIQCFRSSFTRKCWNNSLDRFDRGKGSESDVWRPYIFIRIKYFKKCKNKRPMWSSGELAAAVRFLSGEFVTESFAIRYKIWLDVAFDRDQKAEARSGIPWDNLTLDFNFWRCIGLTKSCALLQHAITLDSSLKTINFNLRTLWHSD